MNESLESALIFICPTLVFIVGLFYVTFQSRRPRRRY